MEASIGEESLYKILARIGKQEITLQKADLISLLNEAGYCQQPRQTELL